MLRHYVELKAANPERILLYRLGDFFECFFEDAIKISRVLELTLTAKEAGKTYGRVPMAGIPHHASDRYCSELIKRGLSVALCDQIESTPTQGSLIKREITKVLTPGTVIEEGMLQASKNNWLSAVFIDIQADNKCYWGLASADVSTGELIVTEREGNSLLFQELLQLDAAEILWDGNEIEATKDWCPNLLHLKAIGQTAFSYNQATIVIKEHYNISTINGLSIQDMPLALRATGGLIEYLKETKPLNIDSLDSINRKQTTISLDSPKAIFPNDALIIDAQTRRNLELTSTQKNGQFQGSLLWAIDRTLTAMGTRCLRRWIEAPLIDIDKIQARQNIVRSLVKNKKLRKDIRRILRAMSDLERLAGRAGAGQAGARDIAAIADGIERLPKLADKLKTIHENTPKWFPNIINIDQNLIELAKIIRDQLITEPPLSLSEGGLINDCVDPILDGLRNQLDDQENWLSNQEFLEKQKSGIQNMKLQYHRTFGYFIAVRKSKAKEVPDHWIRRQTLANEERFITPILKEKEGKIFQTKARAARKEYEIFCKLRDLVGSKSTDIRKAARAVAGLDALSSLSEIAVTNSYCEPTLLKDENNSIRTSIKECRHPVVEQMLAEEEFKANDIQLGGGKDLVILTGPNASGKSCYLRQIGLIQLLAQIGAWVPAKKATLSITDRIFTRVGAVDDLASGQSTFMVEMSETAYILNQATNKSLVLLDEIGRGTATFDGLSIAWAVSEFLANKIKSRTIFATHYHELNSLCESLDNVANFQVLVKETGEDIIFLHTVASGGASKSYGIEAARLAGVPKDVIIRAREILDNLQKQKKLNN